MIPTRTLTCELQKIGDLPSAFGAGGMTDDVNTNCTKLA